MRAFNCDPQKVKRKVYLINISNITINKYLKTCDVWIQNGSNYNSAPSLNFNWEWSLLVVYARKCSCTTSSVYTSAPRANVRPSHKYDRHQLHQHRPGIMRHAFAVPLWWTALHATVKHFDFLLNCTGIGKIYGETTVFESTTNYPNYHILSWRCGKLENLIKCWEQKCQFEPNSKLLIGPDPLKFRQRWLRYWAPGVVGDTDFHKFWNTWKCF